MTTQDVMALILGGGRGKRLHPLTRLRAKPAVPIGGKYRLIDNSEMLGRWQHEYIKS